MLPFVVTDSLAKFDVRCTVKGGGMAGQAGAVRHGLARALQAYNPEFRPPMKKGRLFLFCLLLPFFNDGDCCPPLFDAAGLMTRDPRMVERKKPGKKKARKSYQWVKR